ncbi:MAG: hypothetical protein ACI4PF_00320 [Christensenellales bacterium]
MFENLMRKKFFEGNLFIQEKNITKLVEQENSLLHLVRAVNENAKVDYIDGVMTIKVGGEL